MASSAILTLRRSLHSTESLKYNGGALTVTSGRRPDGVFIWVSDTGTGIGKQQAERLFENFFTTKTDGLGLGLSISRSIVEAHRGKMRASAKPVRGATFFFSLPAATAEDTE